MKEAERILGEKFGEHSGAKLKPLLSKNEIKEEVKRLGETITKDFQDSSAPPILIGILNGSIIFMSDLIRELDIDIEIDFLKIVSYGNSTESSGTVRLEKDINADINGRDVIVVEDIVDTGLSMNFLENRLSQSGTNRLKFVSLLKKKEVEHEFEMDYVGFEIPDRYVVGYGLDLAQKLRNLKSIYYLEK